MNIEAGRNRVQLEIEYCSEKSTARNRVQIGIKFS